jgi:hypothetical protein
MPLLAAVVGLRLSLVADAPADPASMAAFRQHVTLYAADICRFCPLLRRPLSELQRHSRIEIEEADVTVRPEIIREKRLRSAPAPGASGRLLVGNATSALSSEFLRTGPGSREVTGSPHGHQNSASEQVCQGV